MKLRTKKAYIFDVDGTLTEPRQKMTPEFLKAFKLWCRGKQLFIATGSDFPKTKEQVPESILRCFRGIFCCMGNELLSGAGQILEKSNFVIPDDLSDDLAHILVHSTYPLKTGSHLEFRTGMVNFSTVGRNATLSERNEYSKWDLVNGERQKIADIINANYPDLEASVGGSISIDIIEKGKDKGQVVKWLLNKGIDDITFVGDRCAKGGNDFGIIRELNKSSINFNWYNVSGPHEVLELLKRFK
jgi:phosphomannomutase